MIFKKMFKKKLSIYIVLLIIPFSSAFSNNHEFEIWLSTFKKEAIDTGISREVVEDFMAGVKFLPRVIEYDRYQPEFYEDTYTYIKKRTNKKKVKKGLELYKREKLLIDKIEKEFLVEKEVLLSIIKKEILYGSWAGAFGNFQFMPKTIKNYAIDYNKNKTIELTKIEDSFASAANYLNSIGWKKNTPCFIQVKLSNKIPKKYLNSSARKLKNKEKVKFFKNYINSPLNKNLDNNLNAAIITPDKDIIPGSKKLEPAYLVFDNYEKILKWNRSLRFALAVCKLKNNFKDEI